MDGGGTLPLKRGGMYGAADCAPLPPRGECRDRGGACVTPLTVELGYGEGDGALPLKRGGSDRR